jgi:hypothetical protein
MQRKMWLGVDDIECDLLISQLGRSVFLMMMMMVFCCFKVNSLSIRMRSYSVSIQSTNSLWICRLRNVHVGLRLLQADLPIADLEALHSDVHAPMSSRSPSGKPLCCAGSMKRVVCRDSDISTPSLKVRGVFIL